MVKWSIRDRWGKRTENKELKPEVREMLLRLDGVYEQQPVAGSKSESDDDSRRGEAAGARS